MHPHAWWFSAALGNYFPLNVIRHACPALIAHSSTLFFQQSKAAKLENGGFARVYPPVLKSGICPNSCRARLSCRPRHNNTVVTLFECAAHAGVHVRIAAALCLHRQVIMRMEFLMKWYRVTGRCMRNNACRGSLALALARSCLFRLQMWTTKHGRGQLAACGWWAGGQA